MMKRKKIIGLFLFVILILIAAGCSSANSPETEQSADKTDKIMIVAAENFYGEAAKAVGGENVEVTSILDNSVADPEDYEPSANDAKLVSEASIVIYNGLGYDSWMEKLLDASRTDDRTELAVSSEVLGYKEGDNPHVWYNLESMPNLADEIAALLGKIDSENKEIYEKNADAYKNELAGLTEKTAALRSEEPVPIVLSESIFEYMSESLNLEPKNKAFSLAIFNGVEPAARDILAVEEDLKTNNVRLFVYNEKKKDKNVDRLVQLAQDNNVPVVSVTEQIPEGKTYITWMTDQLNSLESALKGD